MKKSIKLLFVSVFLGIISLISTTKADAMGCEATFQCSETVERKCTGSSECEVLSCLFMKCDGIETSLEDCPNCAIIQ